MSPSINDGDIVIYKPLDNNLIKVTSFPIGSIVVAISPLKERVLIIKRVHKISHSGLDLRGDNLESSIDSRHFGFINIEDLYGSVEKIIPNPFRQINI